MSTDFDQTAILIFSRSATHEARVKTFAPIPGKGRNKVIVQNLIRRARSVAKRSGFPVFFHSGSSPNTGAFGENFADALESVFNKGYTKVIAIGNDCPALTSHNMVQAAQYLNDNSLILGPAADGGAYLIGLRLAAYDRASFVAIDWQTNLVLEELQVYADGDFRCLPEKSDVDSAEDLSRILKAGFIPALLKITLGNLIKRLLPTGFYQPIITFHAVLIDCFALRGPPRFAH